MSVKSLLRLAPSCFLASFLLIGPVASAPAQGKAERWVLVYAGGPRRPAYGVDDLVDLLAVVDTSGKPTAWLSTGALFLEFRAVSGRFYMPSGNTPPSSGDDWTDYLDSLFARTGPVDRLDSAAGLVSRTLGTSDRRVNVAVMVPYPDPRGDTTRFNGGRYRMMVDSERFAMTTAYLREAQHRFTTHHWSHLSLTAFYWLNEAIPSSDSAFVSRVASEVHRAGARFLWIPFYTAAGAANWRAFGFDEAWLQPNYFFHPEIPVTRLDSAITRARAASMGLEIEFDARMFSNWQFADRLQPYLAAMESAPDLRSKPIAVYEGAGALIQLARAKDAWHRALYARLIGVVQAP